MTLSPVAAVAELAEDGPAVGRDVRALSELDAEQQARHLKRKA